MSDFSRLISGHVVEIWDQFAYSRSQIVTSICGKNRVTNLNHD